MPASKRVKSGTIEMYQVWITSDTAIVGMRYTNGTVGEGANVVGENEVRIGPNLLGVVQTGKWRDIVHHAYRWVGRGSAAHIAGLVKGYVESYALDVSKSVKRKEEGADSSYTLREIDDED